MKRLTLRSWLKWYVLPYVFLSLLFYIGRDASTLEPWVMLLALVAWIAGPPVLLLGSFSEWWDVYVIGTTIQFTLSYVVVARHRVGDGSAAPIGVVLGFVSLFFGGMVFLIGT